MSPSPIAVTSRGRTAVFAARPVGLSEVHGAVGTRVAAPGDVVTRDPVADAYADRVVFLADGRVVDEMYGPSAEGVPDRMKAFGRTGRTA